ncbi:nucleoside deaminase [Labrenzia sp. VG12]|uniref:nucleoside deaminase n=1 Tax=Labrenzia sp. VG12 TaxID=2021862 RepID=UPI000B8BB381|nr:nucleoside deaminase [Labrenzia sp. VG12]ASP32856.1 tRNA-specific adenosine deaminase [Labrenzia sp. VG12]
MRALQHIDHHTFMSAALQEAEQAGFAGDLPIGAVVICDGEIVGRGRNRIRSRSDKLRHAEVEALETSRHVRASRHKDCVLYTTTEPCVMCLGTIIMADVRHVFFGLPDPARGGSDMMALVPYAADQIHTYEGGILARDSEQLWRRFEQRLP